MNQIGAIAGLGASICWALASVLYTRVPISAGAMTTFKNSLATLFLACALVASSFTSGHPIFQASWAAWLDIGVSGIFGLGLADIAYFRSIQILGARQGLTLTLLTPPSTAILGQWWLGETLSTTIWMCILVTILGIGVVMRARTERTPEQDIRPGSKRWGITCALLGVVTMAVGAVILRRGTQGVGSIEGTFIRLLAASAFGAVLSAVLGQLKEIVILFGNRKGLTDLCMATFLGTVIGVYLMLVSYKYCPSGIAATLTSTTPLFVIPVVFFVYKQRVNSIAVAGAAVAFAGVCGLLLGGTS